MKFTLHWLLACHASPCPLPTTLPGAASPVLSSSPGDGRSLMFVVEISPPSVVCIGAYLVTICVYVLKLDLCPRGLRVGGSNPGRFLLYVDRFYFLMCFATSVKVCSMVNEVSSEQWRSRFDVHRALPPLLLLLLLYVFLNCCFRCRCGFAVSCSCSSSCSGWPSSQLVH